MKKIKIRIKRKENSLDLPVPSYATAGASGLDLYADVEKELVLNPNEIKLISAGFYISIPKGFEAQIRPRSGLALKHGISIVNAPGTIDSDYRGLVGIIMVNVGKSPFKMKRGDRIAQMVIAPVIKAELTEVKTLDKTKRSSGGFGHTGL